METEGLGTRGHVLGSCLPWAPRTGSSSPFPDFEWSLGSGSRAGRKLVLWALHSWLATEAHGGKWSTLGGSVWSTGRSPGGLAGPPLPLPREGVRAAAGASWEPPLKAGQPLVLFPWPLLPTLPTELSMQPRAGPCGPQRELGSASFSGVTAESGPSGSCTCVSCVCTCAPV